MDISHNHTQYTDIHIHPYRHTFSPVIPICIASRASKTGKLTKKNGLSMLLSVYVLNPLFFPWSIPWAGVLWNTLWEMKCPEKAGHRAHAVAALVMKPLVLLVSETLKSTGTKNL